MFVCCGPCVCWGSASDEEGTIQVLESRAYKSVQIRPNLASMNRGTSVAWLRCRVAAKAPYRRWKGFSSRRAQPPPLPPLEGFPFEINESEARQRFAQFSKDNHFSSGLAISNVMRRRTFKAHEQVTATFVPFWAFDCGVRTLSGTTILRETQTGYSDTSMVYGGYNYHRHLLQGLASPLLGAEPFQSR